MYVNLKLSHFFNKKKKYFIILEKRNLKYKNDF